MKQNKTSKRAVLTSALSLLLCCTMLIGTTWAWFTDSVTSAGNIIKSGTLDVEMTWADGTKDPTDDNTAWTDASTGAIFNYDLWEPGYVEVKHVKIANVGTLAFKYQIVIKANGELTKTADGKTLADAIDVYYLENAAQVADRADLAAYNPECTLAQFLENNATANNTATGKLYPKDNTDSLPDNHTVTIALKMRESAGNEYQDMAIGTDFSVQLLATQWTYEEDTFDNKYDDGLIPAVGMVMQEKDGFVLGVTDAGDTVLAGATGSFTDTELNIPEGVTKVGDNAFYDNKQITSVTTPSTLKEIGDYAFLSNSNMYATGTITELHLNSGLESIGYRAFKAQKITSLTIPNTVKNIVSAFYQCSDLQSVTFEPVSQITDLTQAFGYCTSLSSITLPENLVILGQDALRETAITSLTIPASVTTIGSQALRQCNQLNDIYLNCNSTPTIAGNTFTNCPQTITIHVADSTVLSELLTANSMTEGVAKTVWGAKIILKAAE